MMRALRSVLLLLRRVIGLDDILYHGMARDVANRLRKMQIRGAIEQMRIFLVGNTLFAPVLSFQAWGAGVNGLVLGWTALILCFSWWLFWRWLSMYRTDGRAAHMRHFVRQTKVNAALWGLGMMLFYHHVEGDQKTILTCVLIGSLALGAVGFSLAPIAALWYLAVQSAALVVVTMTHGLTHGSSNDLLLGALAFVASIALFNAILKSAKEQMRAFKNHEALAQKTEVVDLLLKDYEEQGTEWIWRTDPQGRLVSCPAQILELLDVAAQDIEKTDLIGTIKRAVDGAHQPEVSKIKAAFGKRVDLHDVVLPLGAAGGAGVRWIVMKGRPQFDDSEFLGFRGFFADATATIEAQKHVEFLAKHDPLTNAYNRNYVQALLETLDPETDHALVFLIDLDGFKQVNDGYGHFVGDKLLKVVSKRLHTALERTAKIARLGGDEFLVFCHLNGRSALQVQDDIASQLLECMSKPFKIDHLEISLSGSVGVAKFPQDTEHGITLLNQVDLALYAAKRGGRNRCVAFAAKMMEGVQQRIVVTEKLRKAVHAGQIEPYYQPQYCTKTGKMVGAEALARWHDAEQGFIGPDLFITIAEETGLIHELGAQLLRRACLDALTWAPRDDGTPLMLAVNLSPVEVMRGNVTKKIKRILQETGFPASRLEIEITEGVLIDDVPATRFLLEDLSDAGITIALDDFGTGYSSLSYVRALPLNRLKIDRSFVFGIEEPEAQSIISAIVGLSERLGLEVVAEGVETQKGVDILSALGCDVLQGYFFSRPLKAEDFAALTVAERNGQGRRSA